MYLYDNLKLWVGPYQVQAADCGDPESPPLPSLISFSVLVVTVIQLLVHFLLTMTWHCTLLEPPSSSTTYLLPYAWLVYVRLYLLTRCSPHTVPSKKETGKIADSVNKILMGKGVFKEKNTTVLCICISYNAGSFQIAVSFICALR